MRGSSFWNYWVGEPLGWIIESGSRPSVFKKYLETLTPDEVLKSKLRLGLVLSSLYLITILLIGGLLTFLGITFNLWWSLSLIIFLNLFLVNKPKKPLATINYCDVIKILVVCAITVGIFISYFLTSFTHKIPQQDSLVGLIFFSVLIGAGASVSEGKNRILNFFNSIVMGFNITFNLFLAATNNFALNILLFYTLYFIAFFQLPGSVFVYRSLRQANLKSLAEPQRSVEFLRQTIIYQNETIRSGSRELEKLLRRAAFYDWPNTRQELAWLIAERPAYAGLARRILVEHIVQDMQERKTLLDLAGARDRLDFLLPDETIIKNEAIEWTMRALCDIGDNARLYCAEFGLQNDPAKLHRIAFILKTALEKMPQDKTKLTKELKQLKKLLEYWSQVNNIELQKVTGRVWQAI